MEDVVVKELTPRERLAEANDKVNKLRGTKNNLQGQVDAAKKVLEKALQAVREKHDWLVQKNTGLEACSDELLAAQRARHALDEEVGQATKAQCKAADEECQSTFAAFKASPAGRDVPDTPQGGVATGAEHEVLDSDDEEDGSAKGTVIEIGDLVAWKDAFADWIWRADPGSELPNSLLGWLNIWGGAEGEKVAGTFRATANTARQGLATKRNDLATKHGYVVAVHAAGDAGYASALQAELERQCNEVGPEFHAWLTGEVARELNDIWERRSSDLEGGKVKEPDVKATYEFGVDGTFSKDHEGFTKVSGSRRKAGDKNSDKSTAADLGEKKKVINGMLKGAGAPVAKKT
jgi:hypothetical protein